MEAGTEVEIMALLTGLLSPGLLSCPPYTAQVHLPRDGTVQSVPSVSTQEN